MFYFSSDHHFGHANIIKYCNRPFKDTTEMNEILIKNWNSIITPDDTIYYIGDFSLSFNYVESVLPRLMGQKILISGNHDLCHPSHWKSKTPEKYQTQRQRYKDAGFLDVANYAQLSGLYSLSHFPYDCPRFPKFVEEEIPGKILLCGHVHDSWKTKKTKSGNLMINVGVDVWDYKPVSLKQIEEVINETK